MSTTDFPLGDNRRRASSLVSGLDGATLARAGKAAVVKLDPRRLTAVWGPAHESDVQYLRVFIGQLRQKIEPDPAAPALILTEPGVGYRWMGG